jgi:hypothetical protein
MEIGTFANAAAVHFSVGFHYLDTRTERRVQAYFADNLRSSRPSCWRSKQPIFRDLMLAICNRYERLAAR